MLQHTVVSSKTSADGKLEVSAATASHLAAIGAELAVATGGDTASARVEAMTCTCAKRDGAAHVHHFIESPILKSLNAGVEVRLELEPDTATLRIEPVSA